MYSNGFSLVFSLGFLIVFALSVILVCLILRFIIKVPTELQRKANALEYQNYLEYIKLKNQNPNLYITPPQNAYYNSNGPVHYSENQSITNKDISKPNNSNNDINKS